MRAIDPPAALAGKAACASHGDAPVDGLERMLASHHSATAALEQWCRQQGMADPAQVTAELAAGELVARPDDLPALLGLRGDEPLASRHVRLTCGNRLLSQAQNWYVPERLTAEMNAALASTATPFGKIAAPLGFRRELLESRRGGGADCPAGTVLFQRALLRLPDGRPLAHVVECYAASVLG